MYVGSDASALYTASVRVCCVLKAGFYPTEIKMGISNVTQASVRWLAQKMCLGETL